jgi:hypothetical protein
VRRCLFLSGTEFIAASLPDETALIEAPPPGPAIGPAEVRAAVARALEAPVDGKPFAEQVAERDRVLIAFDGPAFPVPPLRIDPRAAALEALIAALDRRGVPLERIFLLCAAGVTRIYCPTEMAHVAGVQAMASHESACHDAEDLSRLADFGASADGLPLELDARLSEADLVVTLSVAQAPLQGGFATLVGGLASAHTARALYSAANLVRHSPFDPEAPLHKALESAGLALEKKLRLFHVELALDVRASARQLALQGGALPRSLAAWNRVPQALRERASRLVHGEYQLLGAFAGTTAAAHRRALAAVEAANVVRVERAADIAVVGVPSAGPFADGGRTNPVLAASSAFTYLLGWREGPPLFKPGGQVILLAPLREEFDRAAHLPYREFYERVLAATRDPFAMAEHEETLFAGRPEYVSAYRRRHALHGLHPFHTWYFAWSTLSQAGGVFAVGASRPVAQRLGFQAVSSLEEALAQARERAGGAQASIAALTSPPFGVRVG